jgi:hypothetical protein
MNIELFKTIAKRNPTILFIIFSIITLGIYPLFWVISRKKIINQLTESKITESLPTIMIIAYILGSFLQVYGASQGQEGVTAIGGLSNIIYYVLWIVISFQMKNVLKEFSDKNEMKISYNGFFTFLFTFAYINYKLNENIDYIAQNSIVDKEETTTSDKEITSEKTPESPNSIVDKEETPTSVKETTSEKTPDSPEDRLQKLGDMKEKGLINEDEFNSKKEVILKEM